MRKARILSMVLVVAVLAAGTIFEKVHGHAWVAEHYYGSWWFAAMMGAVAVAAAVSIVRHRLWTRPGLLLVHASVVVILAGGGLTTWTARRGSITLQPGQTATTFASPDGEHHLPFGVTLVGFEVVPYAGTGTPMDFASHVLVDGQSRTVSMNNIVRHRGYRLYQQDYSADGSSTLGVSHDPWGITVTYCGYAMLLLGLLWPLGTRTLRGRRTVRGAAAVLMLGLAGAPVAASAATTPLPPTLPRHTAEQMGRMYVLYQGRVCPLQTLARDFTTKLTGSPTYRGMSAEQVLGGYLFFTAQWADEPAIKVRGAATLGLKPRSSMNQLSAIDSRRLGPSSDKNLSSAAEKLGLLRMLLSGSLLKLYPMADTAGAITWYAQADPLPPDIDADEYLFVRGSLGYFGELAAKADYDALENAFDKTRLYQERRFKPSPTRIGAERLVGRLGQVRPVAMCSLTVGLLLFAYTLRCLARWRPMPRALTVAATVALALVGAWLLLVIVLRWIAGGHAPMASGFDSMCLMALFAAVASLVIGRRHPVGLAAGTLAMGFCLLVAMMSGSNPPVTSLMPVLNSPLLTLHVAVIMCSYALFFFVAMLGVAGLVAGRRGAYADAPVAALEAALLRPAVGLLAVGIIVGAVWANISWGNYWSWDPKEVWALITLLVYSLPLHRGMLRSRRAQHIYCLTALIAVIITYFGVNLILGGAHSYA